MAISHTWKVESIDVKVKVNEFSDVVHQVHFSCTTKNDAYPFTVIQNYTVLIPFNENNSFTIFHDLKENQVLDWVKEHFVAYTESDPITGLGIGNPISLFPEVEANGESQLNDMIHPKIVKAILPWA